MDYVAAFFEQNELFGEIVHAADPAAPVPTCPGWGVVQLMRHVGRGDRWAAQIISDRVENGLDPRDVRDGKPPADPDGALQWLNDGARALVGAVSEVGADTPVWTFLGPKPAAWWVRRRLHESTVHRADAALALGQEYELPPLLAADGVSEWLDLLAARPGGDSPGPLEPGVVLHLHATDPGLGEAGEWTITGQERGTLDWVAGHGKGAAAVRGSAVELLLALLRRRPSPGPDTRVQVLGEEAVWAHWLAHTGF
jgi:uncharacterized protein (TIGR03083 family)